MNKKNSKMDITEAKKIIEEKSMNFKEECLKSLSFFWDVEPEIEFIDSNTQVDNYDVNHITIVNGNFEIQGLLEDAVNDHSLLIVLGDLIVNRAVIMSEIIITNNLIIKDIAVFDSMGDYYLRVGKDVKAKYYIESDQQEKVNGKWIVEKSYRRGQDPRGILLPECIEDEEYHNFNEIAKRIRENLPVFV